MHWYHDFGPGLSFTTARVNCREDEDNFVDSYCGSFYVDGYNGDGAFRLPPDITAPPTVYGDRLADSNEYYAQVSGYFTPDGYPRYTMSSLTTARFNCYGSDNCYYP